MNYVNVDGEAISSLEWARLYRLPQNRHLLQERVGDALVECCWVGATTEHEVPPKPWCVRVSSTAKGAREEADYVWCPDETSARDAFHRTVARLEK